MHWGNLINTGSQDVNQPHSPVTQLQSLFVYHAVGIEQ